MRAEKNALGPLFGWDFYLLPDSNSARTFVSHDEFLEFRTDDAATARSVNDSLGMDTTSGKQEKPGGQ